MSCRDFEKDLLLHADGELLGQVSLNLLAHLQNCPDCGRKLISQQQLRASIARVMGDLKAPAHLQAAISSVLEADAIRADSPPALRQGWTIRLQWPAAIAAVIALAGIALWQYQPWAAKVDPAARLQPVRATDEGPVAIELARSVHKLHIKCAMLGHAHQDPALPKDAQAAADQMAASLGISVLSGNQLRLADGVARFESARICPLTDAASAAHPAAHLIYRNRAEEPISLFSTSPFADVTGLKTKTVDGRSYAILAPGVSTQCHPITIVAWSDDRASYLVCAPYADEETMEYVKPIRTALERNPALTARLLAALDR